MVNNGQYYSVLSLDTPASKPTPLVMYRAKVGDQSMNSLTIIVSAYQAGIE